MTDKELILQQIRDAKRTGDMEWVKELQEELRRLEQQEQDDHEARAEDEQASMDETPENDEESLKQIYELDPEVQAELESPMALRANRTLRVLKALLEEPAFLIADTESLVNKVERVLKALVGNHYYLEERHTFGLSADLELAEFARLMRAHRTSKQTIKHGLDRVIEYRTPLGYMSVRVDPRGFIDAISVL